MSSETSNKLKEKLANKNVKTYCVFIGFTAFLWLALQFSKNHSQEVTFNLAYETTDKNKIVKPSSDKEVKMVLEGSGFQLIKYSLFKKTIAMDARKANSKSNNHAFFTGKSMINAIKSGLDYSGDISFIFKDSLHIYYDVFKEKNIPVKLLFNINYAQGFVSTKGLQTSQNKIKVLGPKSIVDTLSFITTEVLNLDKVNKDYEGKIAIKPTTKIEGLSFETKNIPVNLHVDKLTEGEISIPVSVLNIPIKAKVKLFPKQVSVIFGVAVKDYAKLSVNDFKVVADLSKTTEGSNKLSVKLKNFPGNVFNARLTEKEVQYIVIKQ